MTAIEVPTPSLHRAWNSPLVAMEEIVQIALAPVRYPDGRAVADEEVRQVGTLVHRSLHGGVHVWNEHEQAWITPPPSIAGYAALRPLPLAFHPDRMPPWHGLLIAQTAHDISRGLHFEPDTIGAGYHLRAWMRAVRDGVEYLGLSEPSDELRFGAPRPDWARFRIETEPRSRYWANRARILLDHSTRRPAGYLEIRANGATGGNPEVEIANCTTSGTVLAKILLKADGGLHLTSPGNIRLTPAGGDVRVDGTLHADFLQGTWRT